MSSADVEICCRFGDSRALSYAVRWYCGDVCEILQIATFLFFSSGFVF